LLLVYQEPRAKGWENPETRETMDFAELVAWLSDKALAIASASPDSYQPVVSVLDVSIEPGPQ
jgi:hypothetical protein